jgi:hypothetical protein
MFFFSLSRAKAEQTTVDDGDQGRRNAASVETLTPETHEQPSTHSTKSLSLIPIVLLHLMENIERVCLDVEFIHCLL